MIFSTPSTYSLFPKPSFCTLYVSVLPSVWAVDKSTTILLVGVPREKSIVSSSVPPINLSVPSSPIR
jgi:hypothetical protein